MRLFRFPKRNPRNFKGEKPLLRFLRLVIIGLLFAGVIWGFKMSHDRQMKTINPQSSVTTGKGTPEGNILTTDDQEALILYADRFAQVYGVQLEIVIADAENESPLPEAHSEIFIFILCPQTRQITLRMPVSIRSALGESFVTYLINDHFTPFFTSGSWRDGLASALSMIASRLDATIELPATSSTYK